MGRGRWESERQAMWEGLLGPQQQKATASAALLTREGAWYSVAQGNREVAFPYLNLDGLGRVPE